MQSEVQPTDSSESTDKLLKQYITKKYPTTVKPRNLQKKDLEQKDKYNYCKDWMAHEDGISSTNSDIPPSLYAPSLNFSDSLLDLTSISRNNINKGEDTKSRGIDRFDSYKNIKFM